MSASLAAKMAERVYREASSIGSEPDFAAIAYYLCDIVARDKSVMQFWRRSRHRATEIDYLMVSPMDGLVGVWPRGARFADPQNEIYDRIRIGVTLITYWTVNYDS